MRLFVALNLPPDERERIHHGVEPLRERGYPVRWVEPELYHVTLKFLGEVRPERVEAVTRALTRAASATAAFQLRLGGVGAFPTLRRPRVLWVGAEASAALRSLKQDVEWALAECGFERELRAFHPHVTVGRSTHDEGGGPFRGLDELVPRIDYQGSVQVRSLDLMVSQLKRQGPRYSVVSSMPLRVAGDSRRTAAPA